MKTIKLTKKQIKIINHALGEYHLFLESIDNEQFLEHDKSSARLFRSIDNIFKKINS